MPCMRESHVLPEGVWVRAPLVCVGVHVCTHVQRQEAVSVGVCTLCPGSVG